MILIITVLLVPFSASAHPETGSACSNAPGELRRQLSANGASARLDALRGFMEKTIEASGHAPLDLVGRLFADPLAATSAPAVTRSLLPEAAPLDSTPLLESPLDSVIDRLDRVRKQLDVALGAISNEQADQLHRLLSALFERTATGSDLEELEYGPILAEVQAVIDPSALNNAAALLAGLARSEVAEALAGRFRGLPMAETPTWLDAHVSGNIIHAEQTAGGAIIIGGPGKNIYTGPAAVIIDTGGDDIYALPAGDALRIVIDLDGNDTYSSQADGALGGGVLGASLITDHGGNDTYAGGRITQGAAVAGIGMLYDHGGNDQYLAGELAQGAALAGIGVLVDNAGDDVYTAARFAQGFGGVGMLRDQSSSGLKNLPPPLAGKGRGGGKDRAHAHHRLLDRKRPRPPGGLAVAGAATRVRLAWHLQAGRLPAARRRDSAGHRRRGAAKHLDHDQLQQLP